MVHRSTGFAPGVYQSILDASVRVDECVPPNHMARFVVNALEYLDLSHIDNQYRAFHGAVYTPKSLLALLFYSYTNGVLNSRKIEQATYESIPYHYVSGGMHPDHATLIEFRKMFLPDIGALFVEFLLLARAVGVLRLGIVSLDRPIFHAEPTKDGRLRDQARLIALKCMLQGKVKRLLSLVEEEDRIDLPDAFLIADGAVYVKEPLDTLAKARAALDALGERPYDGRGNVQQRAAHTAAGNRSVAAEQQRVSGADRSPEHAQETPHEPTAPDPDQYVLAIGNRRPTAAPVAAWRTVLPSKAAAYCMTCRDSERLLRLPNEGQIILGKTEIGQPAPPDVDLTCDDGVIPSVSPHHARITANNTAHWIEDLGSANGTYLNGFKLALGVRMKLRPGDRVLLGRCRMVYNPVPDWARSPDPSIPHVPILVLTHSGQHIDLPNEGQYVVGRTDAHHAAAPDVDLAVAGELARNVSSRHARIIATGGRHFLERVSSSGDTRLNGRPVRMHEQPLLLQPGDQLWLGGCVLAYDWRLLFTAHQSGGSGLVQHLRAEGDGQQSRAPVQFPKPLSWRRTQ